MNRGERGWKFSPIEISARQAQPDGLVNACQAADLDLDTQVGVDHGLARGNRRSPDLGDWNQATPSFAKAALNLVSGFTPTSRSTSFPS